MFIHVIHDARVLLRSRGVFYQQRVYRGPNNRLFAEWGTGFIRLGGQDATSDPNVSLEALDLPFDPARGPLKEPLVPSDFTQE